MTKDILRSGDVISGAVLAALGAYIFMQSRKWTYYGEDGPGPGFFPIWYGAILVVLSLALIVSAVVKRQQADVVDWREVGKALATWSAFAVSAVLMGWIGFLLSFALLAFFVITVIFRQSPMTAGLVAVGAAAGFYLVFPLALGVQLPTGLVGF